MSDDDVNDLMLLATTLLAQHIARNEREQSPRQGQKRTGPQSWQSETVDACGNCATNSRSTTERIPEKFGHPHNAANVYSLSPARSAEAGQRDGTRPTASNPKRS